MREQHGGGTAKRRAATLLEGTKVPHHRGLKYVESKNCWPRSQGGDRNLAKDPREQSRNRKMHRQAWKVIKTKFRLNTQRVSSPWQVNKGQPLPPETLAEVIAPGYSQGRQEEGDGGVQGGQKGARPNPNLSSGGHLLRSSSRRTQSPMGRDSWVDNPQHFLPPWSLSGLLHILSLSGLECFCGFFVFVFVFTLTS